MFGSKKEKVNVSEDTILVVPGVGEVTLKDLQEKLKTQKPVTVAATQRDALLKEVLQDMWTKDAQDQIIGLTGGEVEAIRKAVKTKAGKGAMPSVGNLIEKGYVVRAKAPGRLSRYVVSKAGAEFAGIDISAVPAATVPELPSAGERAKISKEAHDLL